MRILPEMEAMLATFDDGARDPITEGDVNRDLNEIYQRLAPDADNEHNSGMWAEVLAFALWQNANPSPWGTYFGPVSSFARDDGTMRYSPDIADTEPATIQYWIDRARTAKHPILRARYADLAWDMAPLLGRVRPDVEMARLAIDAYLESLPLRRDPYHQFPCAIRALDLSIQIGDEERTDRSRAALLGLHRNAMADGGQWWIVPDRLLGPARTRLTDPERDQLVEDLRTIARTRSEPSDPKVFDPHATESAVKKLVRHFRRVGNHAEAREWLGVLGRTFEHFASLGDSLLASVALQTAADAFRDAGDADSVRRARMAMEGSIERAQEEMTATEISIPTNPEDDERYLEQLIAEDIPHTFARLALSFLDRASNVAAQVEQSARDAPLQATINQSFMSGSQVSAVVGSVTEDPEGRLILTASQYMSFSERYLLLAFERAITRLAILPEHFVGWADRHNLFASPTLVREGVIAWFQGDYVKAIHVLVPQIEHALRSIARELGLSITKPATSADGASVAINMSDMLYARPELTAALGEDLTLHFRALYADPRGFNLRNFIAHGLLDAGSMTAGTATRVMHTLLLLGGWKEIARKRSADSRATGEEPASQTP